MYRTVSALTLMLSLAVAGPVAAQNPREKKVRDDKVKVEADGFWIYNNLPKAIEEAKKPETRQRRIQSTVEKLAGTG